MSYISDNTFYIYARDKATDKYVLLFELEEGNPLSRFKHEVFAFALNKKHKKLKSLYLYCGRTRLVKCFMYIEKEVPYMDLEFLSKEHAESWDVCREQIPPVYIDLSWLEPAFGKRWVFQVTNDVLIRKYQNYRVEHI